MAVELWDTDDLQACVRDGAEVIVLRGLLSAEDADESARILLQDLNTLTGNRFDVRDPHTYKHMPFNLHGIIKYGSLGYSLGAWQCRIAMRSVFAALYGCHEQYLFGTVDSVAVGIPSAYMDQRVVKRKSKGWFHYNWHFGDGPARTWQGAVCLLDMPADGETFAFYEGSSNRGLREEMVKIWPELLSDQCDFKLLTPDQMTWIKKEKGLEMHRLDCRAGDVYLWRSDLLHCNLMPTNFEYETGRLVSFVCMLPESRVSRQDMAKIQNAVMSKRTMSHSPINPRIDPERPFTYGRPIEFRQIPVDLNQLRRDGYLSIVGLDPIVKRKLEFDVEDDQDPILC